MKTITILKQNADGRFLIHWAENECTPFVVCTDYNKESNSWIWGHYFRDITSAVDYYESQFGNRKISYNRLCELATLFKDGLIEDDAEQAFEYFDDTCEMTDNEKEWFGIERVIVDDSDFEDNSDFWLDWDFEIELDDDEEE